MAENSEIIRTAIEGMVDRQVREICDCWNTDKAVEKLKRFNLFDDYEVKRAMKQVAIEEIQKQMRLDPEFVRAAMSEWLNEHMKELMQYVVREMCPPVWSRSPQTTIKGKGD